MTKGVRGQWRAMIGPLEDERINLLRILDDEERWYDMIRQGLISKAAFEQNLLKCADARHRYNMVKAQIFNMMYAESLGENPLIWKLSRP
jgi:hypothetical protein